MTVIHDRCPCPAEFKHFAAALFNSVLRTPIKRGTGAICSAKWLKSSSYHYLPYLQSRIWEVLLLKNIIIVGPSRAGKTTLARKINEELNYFVISIDKLVATFQGAYPQLDIRLNWNREKTTDNLAPFLGHFLGTFSSGHGVAYELNLDAHAVKGNRFVLEGAYFNFDKISSVLKMYGVEELKDNFLLIGLVQNKKTADEFFNDFKKYDTEDDWTYSLDDNDLREVSQEAIPFSQSMTEYLVKYGFTIYDTSQEREQVFNQIVEDIKLKLV